MISMPATEYKLPKNTERHDSCSVAITSGGRQSCRAIETAPMIVRLTACDRRSHVAQLIDFFSEQSPISAARNAESVDPAIRTTHFVPAHCRMRAIDRDLIRGGHYGQRPCVPHEQAEHMAAPTKAANVKKVLANSEPSTHGQ
jgi:hypothetical protein